MSLALANEIDSLLSGNAIYNDNQASWRYSLESYMGGEMYRNAGHLLKYQLETNQEYAQRLRHTPLDNHCQSVVSVYISFLFRKEPDRDFYWTPTPELESFLKDCDHDGRSLDMFMKDVATWSSVFGNCWIIMAKPDIGALTRADEIQQGVRPYLNLITPLAMLDWSWTRRPSGRYELDYIKYIEDINGDIRVIKEWTLDTIRTSTVDARSRALQDQVVEINGLGMIPAVCAYNGRSMIRGVGVGDIDDIRDAQKFIYNLKSEIQQSVVLDSHPSLVVTPDTQVGTGAGSIIQISETLDPGLRPYLLEYSGASIDSMLTTIEQTIASIDKMANIGAVRATESRTVSGVAMETEFQLLNARLAEKADQLELAEEGIWRLWAAYQGLDYAVEIEYPGSFNIRDVSNEYDQLTKAKAAATDPVITELIDEKIIELLGEDPKDYIPYMQNIVPPEADVSEQEDMMEVDQSEIMDASDQESDDAGA